MSKPMEKDWAPVKRLARHVIHTTELVIKCGVAVSADEGVVVVVVCTYSDWATRRSTRGGVVCVWGRHTGVSRYRKQRPWSTPLYTEGLGARQLLQGLG